MARILIRIENTTASRWAGLAYSSMWTHMSTRGTFGFLSIEKSVHRKKTQAPLQAVVQRLVVGWFGFFWKFAACKVCGFGVSVRNV